MAPDKIEVYEAEPGHGRPQYEYKPGALTFLAFDAPLPRAGDIILLSRGATGDTEEQAFIFGGGLAPFRVLDVEHLYGDPEKGAAPGQPNPAPYLKSWVHVRRLTDEEYAADPG